LRRSSKAAGSFRREVLIKPHAKTQRRRRTHTKTPRHKDIKKKWKVDCTTTQGRRIKKSTLLKKMKKPSNLSIESEKLSSILSFRCLLPHLPLLSFPYVIKRFIFRFSPWSLCLCVRSSSVLPLVSLCEFLLLVSSVPP